MQLFAIVQFHVLVYNFWQLMDSLSEFDALFTDLPIDGHHTILLCFVDELNFLHSFDLFGELLITLRPHFGQFSAIGALKRRISDVLARLIVLLNEEPRFDQYDPALFVARFAPDCLKAVIFRLSALVAKDVQFGSTEIQIKLVADITSLLLKRLLETVESFLKIFLLILARLKQKSAEVLVRVVLEVVLNLDGLAFMRHLHQSLKFWPLEHLGSDLFAVERVIDPLLHVSLLLLWSHLG